MFHLTPGEPLADGVRDVARDQLDSALALFDRRSEADPHERVHEARKRCKKVRALVRLVRDDVPATYDEVNTELRDVARLVSAERDAAAAVETHDALASALGEERLAPFAPVRAALVERRDGPALARIEERLPEVRERLATVRWTVDGWELPDGDGVHVLRAGYERTYGRAVDRWEEALDAPSTAVWHQWRKRVKYHRHHVDLLRAAWPPMMTLREELLHDLTDLLGDDHDGAVLREDLRAGWHDLDETTVVAYVGLLDGWRAARQHAALPLARRLLDEQPADHAARVLRAWEHACEEVGDEPPTDPVVPPAV